MLSPAMVRLHVLYEIFLADEIAALVALAEEANDWRHRFWFSSETPERCAEMWVLFQASPFFFEARDWCTLLCEEIFP